MKVLLIFVVMMFSAFTFKVSAQQDSIAVRIKELNIINTRLQELNGGTKIQQFDSLTLQQYQHSNLTELLSDESALYIKSYGVGSLASSSLRGGGASQTAVLWNGINMNSSMNGVLDFSLVPNLFFDEISIQYGGASTLWGSGGFGGAIHLNNELKFNTGTQVNVGFSAGSFGINSQKSKVQLGKKKYVFSLALMRTEADNDFPFTKTIAGKDSVFKQVNSSYLSGGLMAGFKYQTNKYSLLQLDLWYQKTERKIPPTISSLTSKAFQEDAAFRSSITWKYFKKKNKFQVKGAYFKELIYFSDSSSGLFANNYADNIVNQADFTHDFNKSIQLNIGVLNTIILSETDNYDKQINENRASLFSSLKYQNDKKNFVAILSGRQAMVDEKFVKPTAAFQLSYSVVKWLALKGKASTVYRVPTLNDKYWSPGGNPLLNPEEGYSIEGGVEVNSINRGKSINKQKWSAASEITVFNKNIANWIVWVPGANFWAPQNVKQVWSRGVESLSEMKFKQNDFLISMKLMTNYVLSTNEKVDNSNDNSFKKQLIYVPRYTGFLKVSILYKKATISYRHNYTGYVFTATDNSMYLSPFDVGALYMSYQTSIQKYGISGFFQINNIWNEEYQRVVSRPMPLIAYAFGLTVSFNNKNQL